MTLKQDTARAASTLEKLRANQAALEQKAKQLSARKSDVEARVDQLAKSLKRNIDTREKILLGALVKKAGLDRFTLSRQNDNDMATSEQPNSNVMTAYDLDLLVGALSELKEALIDASPESLESIRNTGKAVRQDKNKSN